MTASGSNGETAATGPDATGPDAVEPADDEAAGTGPQAVGPDAVGPDTNGPPVAVEPTTAAELAAPAGPTTAVELAAAVEPAAPTERAGAVELAAPTEEPAGAVEPTTAAEPAAAEPVGSQPARRGLLALALGLLVAIVIVEVWAGVALRPARQANHKAQVLAIPGVSRMIRGAQLDPTELAQVAAGQRRPTPLALPAQALIDGLLLLSAAAMGLPQLFTRGGAPRRARLGSFVGSLAILLAGVAVVVAAVARLRFLVALYLSPPYGTLSYLLLYGQFQRGDSLVVLTVAMALKLGVCIAFFRAFPRASGERGMAGLALTSIAATVLATFGYVVAPTSLANIADALVASVVALVAICWAGVIVSGSVRRLA